MFSAILATLISATPFPTNAQSVIGNGAVKYGLLDFSEVNLLDLISLIFTVALGIAAVLIAIKSNEISRTAITQSERTLEHENTMRELENKIAVIDKAFDVYHYFIAKASVISYYRDSTFDELIKKSEDAIYIMYISTFIFKYSVLSKIRTQQEIVIDSLLTLVAIERDIIKASDPSLPKTKAVIELEERKLAYIATIEERIKDMSVNTVLALNEYRLNL